MIQEGIQFTTNLSFFLAWLYSLISFPTISLKDKIKSLIFYFFFSGIFYLIFSYSAVRSIYTFFDFKEFYFSKTHLFLQVICQSLVVYAYIRYSKKLILTLVPILSGPFLYFLLFGIEDFQLGTDFSSFGLLKAQNPLIFMIFGVSFFLPSKRYLNFIGIGLLIILSIGTYMVKKDFYKPDLTYSLYIPPENFFQKDYSILEEENGLYVLRLRDSDQILYQTNLHHLVDLDYEQRQYLQFLVAKMKFPVITKEGMDIRITDLSRSFQDKFFSVVYFSESRTFLVEGPRF